MRVNNAIMVARTRLMTADWGRGGETGDEFNYLEHTHISSLTISCTQPPDKDILLSMGNNNKEYQVIFCFVPFFSPDQKQKRQAGKKETQTK